MVLKMTTQRSRVAVTLRTADEFALEWLLGAMCHHVSIPVTRRMVLSSAVHTVNIIIIIIHIFI